MRRRSPEAGITLVELTVVLLAIAILTGAAAPVVSRTIDRAKIVRAVSDEAAIKTAIRNFQTDLNAYQGFNVDGTSSSSTPVEMAVSDGDIPAIGTGDSRWGTVVEITATPIITDFLERHLVTNNPFGDATKAYPLSGGNTWRGAYINAPIDPDPWGNRYAVNIKFAQAPSDTTNDVIVLSAGPDERVDTAFQQNGIFPGGDDIIVVVSRDRNTPIP